MQALDKIYGSLFDNIVNPILYAFSAACFVYFLYGVFMFILAKHNGTDDEIAKGKKHMLWGLIGLVIIYSAGSVYTFITGLFN
ncbi:MAG: hypothetical protein WCO35_02030 [Candidatus Nomurabacteria bacterium]